MGQSMSWEEMKGNFPDEWVAVADYKRTSAIGVAGTIVAHGRDKEAFHVSVKDLMVKYGKIAVRYTGRLVKNQEIPLLWQISRTS